MAEESLQHEQFEKVTVLGRWKEWAIVNVKKFIGFIKMTLSVGFLLL